MIILAIGMPRAGSGWHYNLTHDLMRTAGATDAREIRRRYHLGGILSGVNCNIGVLSVRRLLMVMVPSRLGHTFTLKAHSGPTPLALGLIRRGHLRPTYIYRDPRDALLSAYEYGQRALAKGRPNAFSHLSTIEAAIPFITPYVRDWERWMACPELHPVRYEELRADYQPRAEALARFLGLDPQAAPIQGVIDHYAPAQARKGDKGLHFHKGLSGRFRTVFTPAQQALCLEAFGETLVQMGYEPALPAGA